MANDVKYAEVLQEALDASLAQQATSGWMEKNAANVRYLGGGEVKMPVSELSGLGNYDRSKGKYPEGKITLSYETMKLTQDRAAQFYFDRNDVDEANYVLEAAAVMSKFQAEYVAPEIDAYRYMSIFKYALANTRTETWTPDADRVLSHILGVLRNIQDNTGISKSEFVITVPFTTFEMLENSAEITRTLQTTPTAEGDIRTEVNSINGVPIIPVASGRMKTDFVFNDGISDGLFGFEAASGAKDINFIITARQAPIAVSKTDSLKIFSPEVNQDGDGWKTQYRKYHDLWIRKGDMGSVFVSVKG